MSFKILKTFEKGRAELTIVPSHWESGGILKWPKRGAEKLTKDQQAIPAADWQTIKCTVKRKNILSYEVADAELRAMLENTDTEKEDSQSTSRRPLQRRDPLNLNDVADQLIVQENCEITTGNDFQTEQDTYIILSENAEAHAPTSESNSDIQTILQNQAILFQVTNEIIETQKKIMNKLASLSVQIEDSFSRIENENNICTLKNASSCEENKSFTIKQKKNIIELEEMEKLLFDKQYKDKLKKSCLFICSGGSGSGINCAYRILDILFTRVFLCQCSWSGSSRGDRVKVSLKCYKNTLNFFFELINHWDSSYTCEANELFFKNILKNANKRNSVKYERIPTKRHRATGKKSTKKQKTDDASNESIETENFSLPVIADHQIIDINKGAKNIENICDAEEEAVEEEESLC